MSFDAIVVGLGAHGAATLYQLAKSGARVLGIDRWSPPHAMGSSHGETRITRQGVGEGETFAPLAIRSHHIWKDLEAASGERLLLECGMLFISDGDSGQMHGTSDFVGRSADVALKFGIPHEMLTSEEARYRFPQFLLRGHEKIYYEPGGGIVYPERCIAVQLAEAERLRACVMRNVRVDAVGEDNNEAWVICGGDTYTAQKVVVTAGAWTPDLVKDLSGIKLQPQVLHWFDCNDPALYSADRMPAFAWLHGSRQEESFYGFPIAFDAPTRAVKVAMETTAEISAPDLLNRASSPAAADAMFNDHLKGRMDGILPHALKSVVCLYATAPGADFIVRWSQDHGRVLAVSACSGHGFKHSAALGEWVALST